MGGPLSVVKDFTHIWTSHIHSLLLSFSANFVGYSYYIYIHNISRCWKAMSDPIKNQAMSYAYITET